MGRHVADRWRSILSRVLVEGTRVGVEHGGVVKDGGDRSADGQAVEQDDGFDDLRTKPMKQRERSAPGAKIVSC